MSADGGGAAAGHSLLDLLTPEARNGLLKSCEPLAFNFGDPIVRQGAEADSMFIVISGTARVVKSASGEDLVLGTLRAGDVFGETALLEGGERGATVRASGEVNVLRLERAQFEELSGRQPAVRAWLTQCSRARATFALLRSVGAFQRLPPTVVRELVANFEAETVPAGTRIITQGEPAGPMYLVQSGRLRVDRDVDGTTRTLAWLREGDIAGEMSLLRNEPRSATVEAVGECDLLKLSPDAYDRLRERWPEFEHAVEERIATYDFDSQARLPLDMSEIVAARPPMDEPESAPEIDADAADATDQAAPPRRWFGRARRRRRFPFVQQIDEMDCGVACLDMIVRYHGRRVSRTRLHELAHTATDGTSLSNLCRAAEELGLAARRLKVSKRHLDSTPLPALIHWKNFHWVVLVELTPERARIADPAVGMCWFSRTELEEHWNGYAALFDVTPEFSQGSEERSTWGWLVPIVRPHLGTIGRALGLAVAASVLALTLPVLSQVVVDRVVVGGAPDALTMVLLALVTAFAFRTVAQLLQGYLLAFVAVRLDARVLDHLARRLLSLPVSYFQARRHADIQRRLDGVRQVRQMAVTNGVGAALSIVQIVLALGLMLAYSRSLTLAFLLLLPLYGGLVAMAGSRLRQLFHELEETLGWYRHEQLDAIKGIEAVKTASAEGEFCQGLLQRFTEMTGKQYRSDLWVLAYQAGVEAATFLASLLMLWLGARATVRGELSLGGFVAFNALVAMAVAPLRLVLQDWDQAQLAQVLVARVRDVIDAEPEQGHDRSRLRPVNSISGQIDLADVGFRYGGRDSAPVLNGVSLSVRPGKVVAIVGRSGSGKTTLVKLLAGIHLPTEGNIRYDGVDLTTLNLKELRRKIGFVLQDSYLFSGTVLDNITVGLEANHDRAVAAARAANAHEFIENLPLGYDTRVGEAGIQLSGGQRQRISIARAFYRNPAVLVFDEATSALDAESEAEVLENSRSLFQGRTVFVVAHRLSTVRDADWTVVLERGEIAEQGTHDELMDRRGIYFWLVSRQMAR